MKNLFLFCVFNGCLQGLAALSGDGFRELHLVAVAVAVVAAIVAVACGNREGARKGKR